MSLYSKISNSPYTIQPTLKGQNSFQLSYIILGINLQTIRQIRKIYILSFLSFAITILICAYQSSASNLLIQNSTIGISYYTGAGVSPQLQTEILQAIINAYNQNGRYYLGDQVQSISKQLEMNSDYKFTAIIINENPSDSWFTLQGQDEIYVVWPGVNKLEVTQTYLVFANGKKDDKKIQKQVFYTAIGSGISTNQKITIQSAIANLQQKSCLSAGKYLGSTLQKLDSKPWTSICKPITQPSPNGQFFGFLVTDNYQYYLGKGKKCNCLTYV